MNHVQIKTFLSVVQTRNLTTSAQELYLSQQAVSKHILALENELGFTLFIRGKSRMDLTEAGRYYNRMFSRWSDALNRTQKEVQFLSGKRLSHFSIGFSASIDPLGPLNYSISSFRSKKAETRFWGYQRTNSELMAGLADETMDVALISSRQLTADTRFYCVPVAKENICLHVPAQIHAQTIDPNCWGMPLYVISGDTYGYHERRSDGVPMRSDLNLRPSCVIHMPNFASIVASVNITPGGILCDHNYSPLANADTLRPLSLELQSYVCCLWRKWDEHPLIAEFVEHMQKEHDVSSTDIQASCYSGQPK